MNGTLERPNSNPILDMMRDGDTDDMWGLSLAYGFAVAEVLYDADPNLVPSELGYRPGMGGPEVPGPDFDPHSDEGRDVPFETWQVWEHLHQARAPYTGAPTYWLDPTFESRVRELRFAARCLHRYIDWLRDAGMDY